jgi:hypothetical protein
MKANDYRLGTIRNFGVWAELRTMLGCLFNGQLTPSCLSAGEDGWIISVRSTRRLTKDEEVWLNGWFAGFRHITSVTEL